VIRTFSSTEPQLFSQSELNDLVRDLRLSKDSAEVLGSRLNQRIYCLLAPLSYGTGTEKKSLFHISLKMGTQCTAVMFLD
jgi:hypothetical protein